MVVERNGVRRLTKTPTSPRRNASKLLVLIVLVNAALAQGQDFKVTLLGTASPAPRPDRFGPSTLVEVGPEKFLFDVGRGVPIRLWQLRVPMGEITVLRRRAGMATPNQNASSTMSAAG